MIYSVIGTKDTAVNKTETYLSWSLYYEGAEAIIKLIIHPNYMKNIYVEMICK